MENVSNQTSLISEKTKINYWMISTIILGFSLILFVVFIFVKQNSLIPPDLGKDQPVLLNSNTPTSKPKKSISGCESVKNYNYAVSDSDTIENWCEIRVFYEWDEDKGYSLSFPGDWKVVLRGAASTNISLEKDDKWMVFVSVAHSDLNIENYDKIQTGFEMSPTKPIIDLQYKVQSKEIIQINNKKVLKVVTTFEGAIYTYYFFDNGLSKDKSVFLVRIIDKVSQNDLQKILLSFSPEFI